ncbi:MAG: hypothetical protein WBL39_09715, partial [Terrimicrobiaceae bacterium]
MAAPIGQTDDLLRGIVGAVGKVEKVTDLIEENLLALLHTDVLAHDDEPIGPRAFAGLIFYLGNVLTDQHLVLIALETNNAFLDSLGLASRRGRNLVAREPRQRLPRPL